MSVGINGMGRIGRLLLRALWERGEYPVSHVNDLNSDLRNLAYLLRYDSVYGRFLGDIRVEREGLVLEGERRRWRLTATASSEVEAVEWGRRGVRVLVEATGVDRNHEACRGLVGDEVPYVVISQRSPFADRSVLFGMVELPAPVPPSSVVSASTCDGVALSPVMDRIVRAFGLEHGFVTTLHPWLSYQNVVDGSLRSVATEGGFEPNYALGRACPNALIPKTTTAAEAVEEHVPSTLGKLQGFSVRVPTAVVSYAVLTLHLERAVTSRELLGVLGEGAPVLRLEGDSLVSSDCVGQEASAAIDTRFTWADEEGHARVCLFYDNEWGYVQRLADVLRHVGPREGES